MGKSKLKLAKPRRATRKPPYTRQFIADGKPGEGSNRNFYRAPKRARSST